MKDIVTPVPPEEVKGVIRKCLEQAAQLNYQRIKDYAKIEGKQNNSIRRPTIAGENVFTVLETFPLHYHGVPLTMMFGFRSTHQSWGFKVENQNKYTLYSLYLPVWLHWDCLSLWTVCFFLHMLNSHISFFVFKSQMSCGIPNDLWQFSGHLLSQSNNSLLCFRPALALCCSVGQVGFCVEVCE